MPAYGLEERRVTRHQFHAHVVPPLAEFRVDALRQAVERAGDEQNAHSGLPWKLEPVSG